jgi:hypothetical protein
LTGKIRLQSLVRPNVIKISSPLTTATPKHKTEKTPSPLMPSMTTGKDAERLKIQCQKQCPFALPLTHFTFINIPSLPPFSLFSFFFFFMMQQNVHHQIAQSFQP